MAGLGVHRGLGGWGEEQGVLDVWSGYGLDRPNYFPNNASHYLDSLLITVANRDVFWETTPGEAGEWGGVMSARTVELRFTPAYTRATAPLGLSQGSFPSAPIVLSFPTDAAETTLSRSDESADTVRTINPRSMQKTASKAFCQFTEPDNLWRCKLTLHSSRPQAARTHSFPP